ncbi:MAG: MarR family transcriptional regulator [Alphaproteobacteria bacterium]|nr:MarR family transcriptional regulator [Alphaproteobacteria bacterium]
MADINAGPNPLFLREDQLHQAMELLFYAYRDFTAECDAILATYGFGRAHHRVIYFVGRYPSLSVSELLGILRITKQSLSRVLGELVEQGFISSRPSPEDKRRRMLELSETGRELESRLSTVQRACIARAYREAGGEAVAGFRKVMLGILNADDRKRFERGA